MLKIDKQKVSHNKLPIGLLLIELVMAILVVYLLYKLAGFQIDFETRAISIAPSADPVLLFFTILALAVLVAVYFVIKKRMPFLFQAQQQAPGTIKQKTREKLALAKTEPRAAALLLIQFIFVFVVAITIAAWLDPNWELIPWSSKNILPPLSTALNAVIAIIALVFFYYLYSFTAWYRK